MCLLIFAHQMDEQYPLILAGNRDEFHNRATRAAQFWPEDPDLLAGKDLQQGGTWMGITRRGRFAAITNYRDPSQTKAAPLSRGELPLQFLVGKMSPAAYLKSLIETAGHYAGFNLLVGDTDSLWYFSNSNDEPGRELAPGIYGLSNANLNTNWPKVELGKATLEALLDSQKSLTHDRLASVVGSREMADLEALRQHGMGGEMEQTLSSQFIISPAYGTRSLTTLWFDRLASAAWREQSFSPEGRIINEVELALTFDEEG